MTSFLCILDYRSAKEDIRDAKGMAVKETFLHYEKSPFLQIVIEKEHLVYAVGEQKFNLFLEKEYVALTRKP